jgi:hypothetical protein
MAAAPEPARFVKVRCWRRSSKWGVSDLSQQAARMSAAICGFLISADVVDLAPYISTNPEDPQLAVETRRVIFARAVADKLTISGTHWLMQLAR